MTAKKAELEKRKGLQIENLRRHSGNQFGPATGAPEDRRARRDRERALGLVPFAIKLPADLVASLRSKAEARGVTIDQLAAEWLAESLKRS